MALKAFWCPLLTTGPRRSSHALAVLSHNVYTFSGELEPRNPVPNTVLTHPLPPSSTSSSSSVAITELPAAATAPPPRVGAAYASTSSTLYVHGGRGGAAMSCLPEQGRVWTFAAADNTWTHLDPVNDAPEERSYHCATVDNLNRLYVHAGCAAEPGRRLNDLWRFDAGERTWERLADAPGAARGGSSICFLEGKVFRLGGFDGKAEVGGGVDVYDITTNTWTTPSLPAATPPARSVSTLLPLVRGGRQYLLTMFGEGKPAPSALGHAGAGKFFGDVWVYDIAANEWHEVEVEVGAEEERPKPRGWFAADVTERGAVVYGGLSEENVRLGDAWELVFEE